jgi:hypothetical protein
MPLRISLLLGYLIVDDETVRHTPYVIQNSVSTVMYSADSTCRKHQTAFSYMSSDPSQSAALEVVIKVRVCVCL